MNKRKTQEQEQNRRAKIHRLRHAVEKIRNVRHSTVKPEEKRQSWFNRLKEQLGFGE